MNSTIRKKITAAIEPIVPIYADEADTDRAPYAVYTFDEEPVYDKDGICGWSADIQIAVCATSYDYASDLASSVIDAMEGLRNELGVQLDGRQPYESTDAKLNVVILSYTVREVI